MVGIEILAERDPSSHVREQEERYSAPHSTILRFSLTSLTYIIIAVIVVGVAWVEFRFIILSCHTLPTRWCDRKFMLAEIEL